MMCRRRGLLHRMLRGQMAVLVLGVLMGAAPTAHALPEVAVLQCVGTQTVKFDPPLTNTPTLTQVQFTEDLGSCLGGRVSSGMSTGGAEETTSCTDVTFPTATANYHWDTGQHSVVSWATNAVVKLADGSIQVVAKGTVTSGLFSGAAAESVVTLPQLDLTACEGSGVASVSGLDTVTINPGW